MWFMQRQDENVIRPASTGLWLQVLITLQARPEMSMGKLIHAQTTGWGVFRMSKKTREISLAVALWQTQSGFKNDFVS